MTLDIKAIQPVIPFEPVSSKAIPGGGQWVGQVKWDGVRILTYYQSGKGGNGGIDVETGTRVEGGVRLINRKGNERTLQYPEFGDASAYCKAGSVILDGEMIAIAGGKPSFHEVMRRDSLRKEQEIRFALTRVPVIYMVFDILYCDGEWVTEYPLAERQKLLTDLIVPSERLQLVPNVSDMDSLFTVMKERGWEGIVCKDLTSTYAIGGKDGRWQKLKLNYDLNAVIGGVTFRDGRVNALLLGLYSPEGHLIYIGHAGSAKWTAGDWRDLTQQVQELLAPSCPFRHIPGRMKGAVWIQPALAVKVQFMEWTPGGTMRHPVIQGFSNVPPEACVLSQQV